MAKEDYLAMLQGPRADPMAGMDDMDMMAMPEEDATTDPALMREDLEEDVDPTTQDGDTIFLDPEMVGESLKKGQQITLNCTVKSIGSKIGLTPVGVESINTATDEDEDIDE